MDKLTSESTPGQEITWIQTAAEAVADSCFLSHLLYAEMVTWVVACIRDDVNPDLFGGPSLLREDLVRAEEKVVELEEEVYYLKLRVKQLLKDLIDIEHQDDPGQTQVENLARCQIEQIRTLSDQCDRLRRKLFCCQHDSDNKSECILQLKAELYNLRLCERQVMDELVCAERLTANQHEQVQGLGVQRDGMAFELAHCRKDKDGMAENILHLKAKLYDYMV